MKKLKKIKLFEEFYNKMKHGSRWADLEYVLNDSSTIWDYEDCIPEFNRNTFKILFDDEELYNKYYGPDLEDADGDLDNIEAFVVMAYVWDITVKDNFGSYELYYDLDIAFEAFENQDMDTWSDQKKEIIAKLEKYFEKIAIDRILEDENDIINKYLEDREGDYPEYDDYD